MKIKCDISSFIIRGQGEKFSPKPRWNSGPGQELVSPPPYEYAKAFLVAAHSFMGIGGSTRARLKVLGLSWNPRETLDKRPLDSDPD